MKKWTTKDKSEWPRGAWDNEPDKAHWVDEKTGLDCLIVRGPAGALCGYVGVPESHEHFNKDYDDVYVDVHGGLSFAGACSPSSDESKGICSPKEGAANEHVWWFGFDCAHSWDEVPLHNWSFSYDSMYRNFDYVKAEVEKLACQLG